MMPEIVQEMPIYAHDFHSNAVPGELPHNRDYRRDVGAIEAYYDANMDLRSPRPSLNLYNYQWPLQTAAYPAGPSRYSADTEGNISRAVDSVVSEGSIICGSEINRSILGRKVFVDRGATVEESVVMARYHIGADAKIRRAIIDKNARIPAGARIGFDKQQDREHYHVSESGIVVVEGFRTLIPVTPVAV